MGVALTLSDHMIAVRDHSFKTVLRLENPLTSDRCVYEGEGAN